MADTPLWKMMREHKAQILGAVPHAVALGLELDDLGDGMAMGHVDWREDLVGDPESGVIAGGVITAFLDNLCGVAVMTTQSRVTSTATLDLRIDYMKPAAPRMRILARAEVYRVTRSVAFVRGLAWQTSDDDPIASATAAFMLSSNAGRKAGANLSPPA
jgi:uncharacterized protein (TIGR00369 family)